MGSDIPSEQTRQKPAWTNADACRANAAGPVCHLLLWAGGQGPAWKVTRRIECKWSPGELPETKSLVWKLWRAPIVPSICNRRFVRFDRQWRAWFARRVRPGSWSDIPGMLGSARFQLQAQALGWSVSLAGGTLRNVAPNHDTSPRNVWQEMTPGIEAQHQPETDKTSGPGVSPMDDYCKLQVSAAVVGCHALCAAQSTSRGPGEWWWRPEPHQLKSGRGRSGESLAFAIITRGCQHVLQKESRAPHARFHSRFWRLRTFPSRADLVLRVGMPRSTFGATAGQGQELDPWRGCRGVVREGQSNRRVLTRSGSRGPRASHRIP